MYFHVTSGHKMSLLCSAHRCLITPFSPISPPTCFSLMGQKLMTLQKAHEMFNFDNMCMCMCVHAHVCAQSCPNLYNPIDCSQPGSSVHGMTCPGKNTEAGCHFLSREYSQPRNPAFFSCVSCVSRQII